MKALVYREKGVFPIAENISFDESQYEEKTVEVELQASGLNRRDYYITQGLYPNVVNDTIMGSDGVGFYDGRRVIINPNINWGDNTAFQGMNYEILGMPKHGTFAEKVVVPAHRLYNAPAHLSDIEAAALPLGAMTAWRAIRTKGEVERGDTVLISGVGGGVAQFALQFALALGAEVFVTSGSPEKLKKAREMGAKDGVLYSKADWFKDLKKMAGGFDVIIDSAGGDGFSHFIPLSHPGGRIVFYGGTLGKITDISPQIIFWRQLSILGTTMASDNEFQEMLDFVDIHKIRPVVDAVFPLEQSEAAFKLLGSGKSFGKIVFDHGK